MWALDRVLICVGISENADKNVGAESAAGTDIDHEQKKVC